MAALCAINCPMKAKANPTRSRPVPKTQQSRQRGRPRSTQGAVGKEAIVAAARELLDDLPPHRVTNLQIARKAGVDPALVRYYFANREVLLLAVIEYILESWTQRHPLPIANSSKRFSQHLASMLDFSRQFRFMQRLMVDECAEAKSPAVRKRVRDLNAEMVHLYANMLHLDEAEASASPEPLFMFVSIIGLCEFYAAAQPMIMPLAPGRMGKEQLAAKYKDFIINLMLDGLRSRIDPAHKN